MEAACDTRDGAETLCLFFGERARGFRFFSRSCPLRPAVENLREWDVLARPDQLSGAAATAHFCEGKRRRPGGLQKVIK